MSAEPYVPQVGHRVRLTIEGVVTDVDSRFVTVHGRSYFLSEGTWERLPDPEPDWQYGDVVRDANGYVYVQNAHRTWRSSFGHIGYPLRPLTRLVPEVKA